MNIYLVVLFATIGANIEVFLRMLHFGFVDEAHVPETAEMCIRDRICIILF